MKHPMRPVREIEMDWFRQAGDGVIYSVGPTSQFPGDKVVPLEQCAHDAVTLMADKVVHWEPGDGTSYQVTLLFRGGRRYLAFVNPSFPGLLPLRDGVTVGDYVRSSAPVGGWLGIRPLLVALGATRAGSWPYDLTQRQRDARDEAKERARQHRTQYVSSDDEALGRQVRLLVQGEGR